MHNILQLFQFGRKTITNKLSIYIKTNTGRSLAVDLNPKWDIREVKEFVAPQLDLLPDEVKIIFAGKELGDDIIIEVNESQCDWLTEFNLFSNWIPITGMWLGWTEYFACCEGPATNYRQTEWTEGEYHSRVWRRQPIATVVTNVNRFAIGTRWPWKYQRRTWVCNKKGCSQMTSPARAGEVGRHLWTAPNF